MSNVMMQVNHLSAGYQGHKVIEDISFQVEQGKIYSIIGPNGCGKTTLIRAVSRNIRPSAGQVLLDGENIYKMNTRKVAQKVAVLSQSNNTMSDVSVRTLVQYGRFAHMAWWQGRSAQDERIVDWALEKTGMTDFANRKINALSGGERQRAWIANREENITILMVLHDINHAVRYSDELIVLQDHRIYRQGDPWSILSSDVLEKVFRVQAQITADSENGTPIFYAKAVIR